MKQRLLKRCRYLSFLLFYGTFIFVLGYFFLESRLEENLSVSDNAYDVVYEAQKPEDCSVLLEICEDRLLLDLSFSTDELNVIFLQENEAPLNYGYLNDYTVTWDYETVGYLVDSLGGIVLENNGTLLRYTGVQITDLMTFTNADYTLKKTIAKEIFKGISKSGLSKEVLLYLVGHSETDLNFSVCFSWSAFLPELSQNIKIIE